MKKSRAVSLGRTKSLASTEVVAVVIVLCVWEFAAMLIQQQGSANADKVFPTLQYIFTSGFSGLARYCHVTMTGASSLQKALVALLSNSGITLMRVVIGYLVAMLAAFVVALHLSQNKSLRKALSGPVNLARVSPAFAMAPLFILWFGATTQAAMVFIVFSVFFMVLVSELDAIASIEKPVIEYAQTMGISRARFLYGVLLPASMTSMRGTVTFAGLVAWTSVLSAELNGLQDGLGYIVADSIRFSNISEMFLASICFCVLSFLTMKALECFMDRMMRWNG